MVIDGGQSEGWQRSL